MSADYIQEVPNSFSIFVTRKGNLLYDRNGLIVASIGPIRFAGLREDVEVEMIFKPMSECEALKGEA